MPTGGSPFFSFFAQNYTKDDESEDDDEDADEQPDFFGKMM